MDRQAIYDFILEAADQVPSDSQRFGIVLVVHADKLGWATFGMSDLKMAPKDVAERFLLPAYMAAVPKA